MNWGDVGSIVGKTAPILGTILGGPAGGAIGMLLSSLLGSGNSPDAVNAAILADPQAALKLAQFESDNKVQIQRMLLAHADNIVAADTQAIVAVNATMQAETKSEHWASWLWRPFNGFIFGATFLGVYFVLPLAKIPVPLIPFEAWTAMGAILGVASWFRGKAQADPSNPAQVKG